MSNGGTLTNDTTLVGADPAAPVGLHNVAPGRIAAGSSDAVTGAQVYTLATTAANAVQYDRAADGSRADSVSLSGGSGAPVTVHNVAPGAAATDAVNVAQLGTGLGQAFSASASYTDTRVNQLRAGLSSARRDASGGTAAAMALTTIPQAYGPGMGMVGFGLGTWDGQQALAIGASKATPDGSFMVKVGATYNTRGDGGAALGAGFAF